MKAPSAKVAALDQRLANLAAERKVNLRAQRADRARRMEMLRLDHIEQAIGKVRELIAGMSDVALLDARSKLSGYIVEDPFNCWLFKSVKTPAKAMVEAMYAHNLGDVVDGILPTPEGAVYDSCPNPRCPGFRELKTFEWVREHTATCIPEAHARGIAVDDPWGRFDYTDTPRFSWTRSLRGLELALCERDTLNRRPWRGTSAVAGLGRAPEPQLGLFAEAS